MQLLLGYPLSASSPTFQGFAADNEREGDAEGEAGDAAGRGRAAAEKKSRSGGGGWAVVSASP